MSPNSSSADAISESLNYKTITRGASTRGVCRTAAHYSWAVHLCEHLSLCVWTSVSVRWLPRVLITTNRKCMTLYPVFTGDLCVCECVFLSVIGDEVYNKKETHVPNNERRTHTVFYSSNLSTWFCIVIERSVCIVSGLWHLLSEISHYSNAISKPGLKTLVSSSRELNGNNLTRINRNDFSGLKYLRVLWVLHLYILHILYILNMW